MEAEALYNRDFYQWVQCNVELLRRGCLERADVEHIVEELEGLANRDRRAVENRLVVLMMHLLKWQMQPGRRYSKSGKSSWLRTILEQRGRLAQFLEASPSLVPFARTVVAEKYPRAARLASAETGLPVQQFPGECPFTLDQVLDEEFLPE